MEEIQVDYDFCRLAKLTAKDLLIWLDLDKSVDQYGYSYDFFGRNLMLIDNNIRVSCIHKDFDRWANSEEYLFDITKRGDKRDFIDFVIKQREIEQLKKEKSEKKLMITVESTTHP